MSANHEATTMSRLTNILLSLTAVAAVFFLMNLNAEAGAPGVVILYDDIENRYNPIQHEGDAGDDDGVTETPVTETPVTETPVTETPVTETPVTETPVTETPGNNGHQNNGLGNNVDADGNRTMCDPSNPAQGDECADSPDIEAPGNKKK